MTEILTIFLIILLAILIIGPKRLPEGVEQVWLIWENFRLNRYGAEPINLEQARKLWAAQRNIAYISTRFLYETAEHLNELRRRMLVALIVFGLCIALSFFFINQIMAVLLAPINAIQQTPQAVKTNMYVQQDVSITTTIIISGTAAPVSATLILPKGLPLPI